jgi:hypothetical protein
MKLWELTDLLYLGNMSRVSHHCQKHRTLLPTNALLVTLWQFHVAPHTLHQLLETCFNHHLHIVLKENSIKTSFAYELNVRISELCFYDKWNVY